MGRMGRYCGPAMDTEVECVSPNPPKRWAVALTGLRPRCPCASAAAPASLVEAVRQRSLAGVADLRNAA